LSEEARNRKSAKVVDPATAPRGELRRDRGYTVELVNPGIGATQIDLHVNVLTRGGAEGPSHLHRTSENVYYVLEGKVRVRIDGVDHELTAGMAGFVPPGVPHSVTNIGDQDAKIVEIYSPPDAGYEVIEDEG
jgi:mannose-6-phosphate isomerase-like protein (cupin superfamily)